MTRSNMKYGRKNIDELPAETHAFITAPHKTLWRLALPVLLSLIVEPLTGLVDTAFVARMGSTSLAALGVGIALLSTMFWVFNFLGIGSQTEVARALGEGDTKQVCQMATLAIALAFFLGVIIFLLIFPVVSLCVDFMGASGEVHGQAESYVRIRLLGGPGVLVSIAAFGIMRGQQDMSTPLWVAGGINVMNMILDPLLIFGWGPFPAMGVAGAALASVIAQWTGALACVWCVFKRWGYSRELNIFQTVALLKVGRDLFIRTGMLTLFLLLTTRAATAIGPGAGAAHQAIRQTWFLTAFILDAYALAGQSLVAFFIGSDQHLQARRVAWVVCQWSLGTGMMLSIVMLVGEKTFMGLLVPEAASLIFVEPWRISALAMPISSLAFATDGIHWGTGDYRYLRNVVLLATISCTILLFSFEFFAVLTLPVVWWLSVIWMFIRAGGGIFRIWPGIGNTPLNEFSKL